MANPCADPIQGPPDEAEALAVQFQGAIAVALGVPLLGQEGVHPLLPEGGGSLAVWHPASPSRSAVRAVERLTLMWRPAADAEHDAGPLQQSLSVGHGQPYITIWPLTV